MTRLALAGAGWAAAIHGLAADGLDDVEITRVASRTQASRDRRARQVQGVACAYEDLPGDADAVVVVTPPHLHLRETRRALDAGAAVLVEAPLAATLADADELEKAGGIVAYGENLVHAPAVADAVRAVRAIGTLTHLDVRFAQGRPESAAHLEPDWGGGALFDPGAHATALALLLAAPARVVEAEATLHRPPGLPVDDDATLQLRFDSGLQAQVRVTWRRSAPAWDAQAASHSSSVRLELAPKARVEVGGAPVALLPAPPGLASPQLHDLGYVSQLAALQRAVADQRPPSCGPTFGRAVLDVLCAAYASARTGQPEPLPFRGPRHRTPVQLWQEDQLGQDDQPGHDAERSSPDSDDDPRPEDTEPHPRNN